MTLKLRNDVSPRTILARSTASILLILAALVITLAPTGCSRTPEAPPDIVVAHTEGPISAADEIRVRFARDLGPEGARDVEVAPSPIGLRPKVEGTARWTAPDVLTFRPSERLRNGERYEVTLDLAAVVPDASGTFVFEFEVIPQSLELDVAGLETTGGDGLRLTGTLRTADVADETEIGRCLSAVLDGTELSIDWPRPADGRLHAFAVEGIDRGEKDRTLVLEYDGTPIGADSHGRREITIVRRGVFAVTSARTVDRDGDLIEIRFSSNIDPDQDLEGLIDISDHEDLRFEISGNIVRVHATGGWNDEEMVVVDPGLRSAEGQRLGVRYEKTLHFQPPLPAVRFAGSGVIVPSTDGLTLPIEVTALTAVEVEATQVFEDNLPQFFQVNALDETDELRRVGRVIWKRRIVLPDDGGSGDGRRIGLDLGPLVSSHPGGLYHLKLRFTRADIAWECSGDLVFPTPRPESGGWDEDESSYWDFWEDSGDYDWGELFENRKNPCHPGFYRSYYDHDIVVERNVLLSNLGLVAKVGDDGGVFVLVTDLRTARPLEGVDVTVLDFQQQETASGTTDADGFVRLEAGEDPFLVIARRGDQVGYLKLDDGQALSFSRFDVGGAEVRRGLKGFIYSERGVWRPGDHMHLGFILFDPEKTLPPDHPVVFELRNPLDQLVEKETRTASAGPIFVFEPSTGETAPTGDYRLTVRIGDATFEKSLKVAMIRPNRLRIALETDEPEIRAPRLRLRGLLEAAWLHGGTAGGLETRIDARLRPATTVFDSRPDFVFDDPTREVDGEEWTLFDGGLNAGGQLRLNEPVDVETAVPGKLEADLTIRVFEPGGAFSITETSVPVSPYTRYVGLRTEPGDARRGMLLTDTDHRVDLALVDQDGRPVDGEVAVSLYKIAWRWWWEKGGDDGLVDFAESSSLEPVASGTVRLAGGEGSWTFSVSYPEWGRFLLLAEDPDGGHRTGKVIYLDWPGWAGKARKGAGDSAEVLSLSLDRESYAVGDEVELTIPSAAPGTILVSLEKGSRILHSELIDARPERTAYRFTVTEGMTPNLYAVVTFLQPHEHPDNDLPIRMYGVQPIAVTDPGSRLEPLIDVPESFRPETTGTISVSEASGRGMRYTVAVVDEGLLGLTGFVTPDPWAAFNRREALGVRTWDLYDDVVGAWGSVLESLLAVGGGESGKVKAGARKERRFPPMVRFLGPFTLKPGQTATHEIDVPLYVGSVRVMVVAAEGSAFGRGSRDVPVRKELMVLGSLPRELAPGESLDWPVSVFVMEGGPKSVRLEAEIDGPVSVEGEAVKTLDFPEPGEATTAFRIRVGEGEGSAKFTIRASGGGQSSRHESRLEIRRPARPVTTVLRHRLAPGSESTTTIRPPRNPVGRSVRLEVSRIPPIDLGRRLDRLIHYPYGCLEQTVSGAFPQLYLDRLVELGPDRKTEIERNVGAALERLRQFQMASGGLSLWPVVSGGFWSSAPRYEVDRWATTYAGHFLLEAKRAGYRVPGEVLQKWEAFQRDAARRFDSDRDEDLILQAYRLEILALAGAPELGAMNRLRETPRLPVVARWQLAAAYGLSGRPEVGRELVADAPTDFEPYTDLGGNYGSDVRDRAIVLDALGILGLDVRKDGPIEALSEALSSDRPLSTQATAFALAAVARSTAEAGTSWSFSYSAGDEHPVRVEATKPLVERELPALPGELRLTNDSEQSLYAALILRGVPDRDEERAVSQGLELMVTYLDGEDQTRDPRRLEQGTDLRCVVELINPEGGRRMENLALTIPVAEGWEIRGVETEGELDYRDVRDARVDLFCDLAPGETLTATISVTAVFNGRFYLPMVTAEAMYDPSIAARLPGRWVEIVPPGGD